MAGTSRRPVAGLAALAGAVIAVVLGFLTVGVQASVEPDGLPVAVAVPDNAPPQLRAAAGQLTSQGGEALSWRVTTPAEARTLLDDKDVYGVLELAPGQVGVVVSGAVNPSGTQVVQQALTGAGQALSTAMSQATGTPSAPVRVETVHPASPAGRTAPLAVSILAWVGSLAAGAILVVVAERTGRRIGVAARLTQVAVTAVLITGVAAGFLALWDSSLPLGWDVLGYILLVAAAFAAVQAALLRLLGIRAMAILAPLYLLAPNVAGQVPELLNPAYRALLWSWTPFRFSTEGTRSLLQGTPDAPDVTSGIWVLGAMLVAGLVVVLWPGRAKPAVPVEAAPELQPAR
ncbi:ABC transporter permease [Amycolatopsis sp. NPDC006125]|uniref:ABC transporter permease n=1 Tax=Amycolatopsis sp. NPDC006125 TaxID=3156730 RepID=UPI0033AD1D56